MRALANVVFVLLIAWGGWLVYQYVTEAPTAHRLFEQKISELSKIPMDYLVRRTGARSSQETVRVNGRSYRVRWALIIPDVSPDMAGKVYDADRVEASVHVEYLDLLPFGDIQLGPSARFTINTTTGGQEQSQFKRSF